MFEDPIVEEIRRKRKTHAARFGNDLSAISDDIRRLEEQSGRDYVNFPPRRVRDEDDSAESRPAATP